MNRDMPELRSLAAPRPTFRPAADTLDSVVAQHRDLKVWIDIDNPPQVQYLVPFEQAFMAHGARVVLTAREYGNALDLLRQRTSSFKVVGREFGPSKLAKLTGALRRATALRFVLRREEKADVLVCSSRTAALAARSMRIPSFVIVDYEHANSSFYRLTDSTVLYPDVIDPSPFLASGIRQDRLIPFSGIKEDISFAGVVVDDVVPHPFPEISDEALVRVLFRPPAEQTHYYQPGSRELALRTLEYLAARHEVVVVLSPRHSWQRDDLERFEWANPPVVLDRPIPFVSLMKSVDLVICSGGTMLREAAYLGIPAYSILKSPIGGVDQYLASTGRVSLIGSAEELSTIELQKAGRLKPLRGNPRLIEDLVDLVLERVPTSAT
jgi:predicted glycosyltransferase